MGARRRVGVLLSGRGSNMVALAEAARDAAFPAEIALVLSNDAEAGGLERARGFGIAAEAVPHRPFAGDREAHERAIDAVLEAHGIELVCLAGYMRLLTGWFVARWRDRLINIHPSLLPAFKGLETHARALETGVRWHGCSVHFVREAMDEGPIIAQAAVPVAHDDTPDTLNARVLAAEHLLYPHALGLVASGKVRVEGERALVAAHPLPEAELNPPLGAR